MLRYSLAIDRAAGFRCLKELRRLEVAVVVGLEWLKMGGRAVLGLIVGATDRPGFVRLGRNDWWWFVLLDVEEQLEVELAELHEDEMSLCGCCCCLLVLLLFCELVFCRNWSWCEAKMELFSWLM